jgi:O-antigen/teichoic acid export membrane protein
LEHTLRLRALADRTKESNPLPEGTLAVGVGLLVAGVSAYGFLVLSARALGKAEYAPLSVLWAAVFLAGPGFFLPLEQEVSRALAARRALGLGTGPVLRRAAMLGGALAGVLVASTLIASPKLVDGLFHGEWLLLVGLLLGMVGYFVGHLARGSFSGLGRFRPYAVYIGGEGAIRLAICIVLAVVGVEHAGAYGLALGAAPLLAVALSLRGQHGIVTDGPDAPWSELSSALGALLAGSVLAMALVNGPVLLMRHYATQAQDEAIGRFQIGLVIARIPLFLFQAVQAALLPRLSALASAGKFDEFRVGFRKLVAVVAGIGALGVLASFAIGPFVVKTMFGAEFDLGRRTLTMLATGSVLFMLAQAMAQAVIALGGHGRQALCWLASVLVFLVVTALGNDLFFRIELGMVAGSTTAVVGMAALVLFQVRAGAAVHTEDLIEALHDLQLEP